MKLTSQKIIDYIEKKGQVTPHELTEVLEISDRAVFKQLQKLLEKKKLVKSGRPPKVFYTLYKEERSIPEYDINPEIKRCLEENYLMVTPFGERKEGLEGFAYWCNKNGFDLTKKAMEYYQTISKYAEYKRELLIDGSEKMKNSFKNVHLEKTYYIDFYSIEKFGKTKLGWLLLYAKQTQNKKIIKDLVHTFKASILTLIKKQHINAIGFIPPTIKRDVQFMKELQKHLSINLPTIKITKIKTPIIVPQKSLNKLSDRIENIERTIVIEAQNIYHNILLIDDAVGSGATLNETAKKIKDRGLCSGKIYGLAITGSFKGFDVISEV